MDFLEAEQRFRVLEDQRARGILTMDQYRAELNLLRIADAYGRLWMQQEITGQWYVHYNGQWQPAVPPHQSQPVPHAPVVPEPVRPQQAVRAQSVASQVGGVAFDTPSSYSAAPVQQAQPPQSRGVSFDPTPEQAASIQSQPAHFQPSVNAPLPRIGKPKASQVQHAAQVAYGANQVRTGKRRGFGCFGTILLVVIGFPVVWGIISLIVYYASGEDPEALLGVAAAAALSLIITIGSALQNWKGTIVDIRTVRESSSDEDGYTSYRNVTYAFVKKPNGRTKKVRCLRKWRVGDQLEKRVGEFGIRHYPM